jgi:hypothetical protein
MSRACGRYIILGSGQDGPDRVDRLMRPNLGLSRAAHPVERIAVEDSRADSPTQ